MSLSTQYTLKSLAMTPDFEKQLAKVNGVVIASKIPQGGQMYKKKPRTVARTGRKTKTTMTCSICSSGCRDLRELRNHFVTCVGRNGNPSGARWDDCLTPDDATNLRSNPRYAAFRGSTTAAALSSEDIAKLDERNRNNRERLAAVDGIVIPSKLSAGQRPSQGDYERNERQVHLCIVCNRLFAQRHQVREHFPTCVKRNGNPTGARWNDAWNGAASPARHTSTRSSRSPDTQMEDPPPEDDELNDVEFATLLSDTLDGNLDPQLACVPPDALHSFHPHLQRIDFQLPSPPLSGMLPSDPHTETPDFQPSLPSPNGLEPYDPCLRMDVLTNKALLSMVQAWQEVIAYGEERYTLQHPHFQHVMNELVKRDMMSVSWKWTVDIKKVDLAFTAVAVEGSRT